MAPSKEIELLGFMTEQKAKELGFTHHGSYFGVPVYIGDPYGQCMVTTKHPILDPLFDLMGVLEGIFRPLIHPENPAVFQFRLKGRIK
ncbi:hypothetical protein [Aeromonas popoffii]|uniref:hypothetical protein n=1 Tax=Aeromonas popoffii TaxID=70856 RepID=UPI0012ED11B6|nr:hypothetical protein [Aeromonas popoffii]